ncbi:MAG: response regulator transcription factor [Actinomycetota bacterium]|jgi:two-component system response regulator MprA/two-component system response regulator TrcR|nr:response regulator transcription factor [Actinomycetota bacterium]
MIREGTKILVVEDDASIVRLLELELEHRGLSVRTALDGVAGLAEAARFKPDVIVLDIMLPKMDGVGVLRTLRGRGEKTPVVMLTARDDTLDKIHSLNHGADDYLTKPFDVEELLARVGAVLRRSGGEEVIRVSDLTINRATREVRRGERGIELTAREYDVLEFMAKNHRRVLSREVLLSRVWEQEYGIETNVVDVYMGYLRKKVDAPGNAPLIKTIRGVGYTLRED